MIKRFIITIFLITIFYSSFAYKIHYSSNLIKKNDYINKIINRLDYKNIDIQIYEADNLKEFTEISGLPYSYYNGAMINNNKEKIIIIIPFKYFKSHESLIQIIRHELLHYYFNEYTNLKLYEQEGIIQNLLDQINKKHYPEFYNLSFEQLINYIKRRELN